MTAKSLNCKGEIIDISLRIVPKWKPFRVILTTFLYISTDNAQNKRLSLLLWLMVHLFVVVNVTSLMLQVDFNVLLNK